MGFEGSGTFIWTVLGIAGVAAALMYGYMEYQVRMLRTTATKQNTGLLFTSRFLTVGTRTASQEVVVNAPVGRYAADESAADVRRLPRREVAVVLPALGLVCQVKPQVAGNASHASAVKPVADRCTIRFQTADAAKQEALGLPAAPVSVVVIEDVPLPVARNFQSFASQVGLWVERSEQRLRLEREAEQKRVEEEAQAEAAMAALRVQWAPHTPLATTPPLDDLAQALSAHPSTPRVVAEQGAVDDALAGAAQRLDRTYVWPYQLHASIGPSCAVAEWHADAQGQGLSATVWAGTQNPHVLRADLAKLTGLPDTAIDVVRLEASGCYGRNGADDVAADALLLARAVGAPVRVQLTREQEHAWEPKGAAQLMRVRGGLDAQGAPLAYDFDTSYPSNGAPTLALLLTGTVPAVAQAFEMGDRTAVPPYAYAHQRITVNDMAPILRASWLRGVSALPNSFAHESYVDELATAAGVDPVQYRLRHVLDERAAELVRATADKAGWRPHTVPQQQPAQGEWLQGQGFAYARYIHSKFPGFGAAWAAWVADVQVNKTTGEVHVSRVVVGHDAGLMVNPRGVQQQVHGNVLQTTSRALKERVQVDPATRTVASREWGSYPILSFREVPVVEVLLMPRPGEAPLGVGESASVPGTAAIANAIFDATGVRFRNPPFTPEVVRAALNPLPAPTPASPMPAELVQPAVADPQRRRKPLWAVLGAVATGLIGAAAGLAGWRPAIAPVSVNPAGVYSAAVVERGRQLAAIGNCVACHTAEGGTPMAGGRPMHTPFGTVYSTNLTPDAATGIGAWSFSAFQRAMREGSWKLIVSEKPKKEWLFDLAIDPTERNNLAPQNPPQLASMRTAMQAHHASMPAPLWPSFIEMPIPIDKTLNERQLPGDEYVYWYN
ncbi:MAG: hypothetical protein CFE45_03955 [Burkholderiales bacterium PBB5]|nr:MAG: hypothetical protein CFE45_03955 [Burkholderiales bacterium PBB5]